MLKLTKEQLEIVKVVLRNQVRHLAPRIAPVYELLGWEWGDEEVPNQDAIEQGLYEIIAELAITDTHESCCMTGGLYARYIIEADGRIDATIGMDIWEWATVPCRAGELE